MPVVSARSVSKAYGEQHLFSDISLTVRSGERVGLIGANGAGKSTLLRIFAGAELPDTGAVERRRGARVLLLSQEPTLDLLATPRAIVTEGLAEWNAAKSRHDQLTHALSASSSNAALLEEQARLGEAIERLGGWTKDHLALEMLDHLGVREIDRPVGSMSGGERRRVALAQLLVAEPALAILDEPTNHLDTETIEWFEAYLAEKFGGAVLMVTHDRYVLDAVADRIVELDGGRLTEFIGGYAEYLDQKAELAAHAERVEANRLNLMRRESAWLRRGAKARSTKQKARLDRARALVATRPPEEIARASFAGLDQIVQRTGKTIVDLEEVGFSIGERRLIEALTLRLVSGDRVGVVGPNGAGKTSLLRLLTGEIAPTDGKVVRGLNTRFVYFDQSRSDLRDDWSVLDNVAEREGAERTGAGVVRIGERTVELRTYLEQFSFDVRKQRQKVASLSGGERARVALARALKTGANLLLLDEPTNDLDVTTLGSLEELLEGWPGCAFVVSHDRCFLDRVATSILAFEGEGRVTRYPGGYESYRSLRAEAPPRAPPPRAPPPRAPVPAAPTQEKAADAGLKPLTFAERKELEGLLDRISAAEGTAGELEARLADPALYTKDPTEAARAREGYARAAEEVTRLTARWEDLEARREVKRR